LERLLFPKIPEMLMKLKSMETMMKIRLLFVLVAAIPRNMVRMI
jgi:hypothetical protein